ncbi:MAG: nuclear transport factor 2 family protein [Acidobacteria bacterium]|nr:nuclear transport factor 2 family protein [Acidobacteriota bacterium]
MKQSRRQLLQGTLAGHLAMGAGGGQALSASPGAQRRIVLRYFHEVLDGGKVEVLEELLLPDCVIHRPEGELKGLAAMRNMLAARRANFSTFTTEVHDIFESGDRVAVRVTHQGVRQDSEVGCHRHLPVADWEGR